MTSLKLGRAIMRGVGASAVALSMVSTVVAAPPVDLSKWSPEYVRSIAGTEDFDTAAECSKVTPLDYKGDLTFWYQGVFEGDPDLLRQYYKDFFDTFRATYPNINLQEQALTYNDLLDKFRTALLGNAGPMVVRLQILGGVEFASKGYLQELKPEDVGWSQRRFLAGRHEVGHLGRQDLRHSDQQRDDGAHLERRHLQARRPRSGKAAGNLGRRHHAIPSRSTTSSGSPVTASLPARTPATRPTASCRSSGATVVASSTKPMPIRPMAKFV